MIKFFHELTEAEFKALCDKKITYRRLAKDYPQPTWCSYPDALEPLGCWSLTGFMVTGEAYCRRCDCYISRKKRKSKPEAPQG